MSLISSFFGRLGIQYMIFSVKCAKWPHSKKVFFCVFSSSHVCVGFHWGFQFPVTVHKHAGQVDWRVHIGLVIMWVWVCAPCRMFGDCPGLVPTCANCSWDRLRIPLRPWLGLSSYSAGWMDEWMPFIQCIHSEVYFCYFYMNFACALQASHNDFNLFPLVVWCP